MLSIIAIISALAFPVLARMLDSNQMSSGVNTVSLAAETTRRLAESRAYTSSAAGLPKYDGAAMIICPSGEIRLTINDLNARDGTSATANFLEDYMIPRNGYQDAEGFDYVQLPGGVDIYGINRGGSTGVLQYIPPPFAIRFDQTGRLIPGSSLSQSAPGFTTPATTNAISANVFYDHNSDGAYEFSPMPASNGSMTDYHFDPDDADYWKEVYSDSWNAAAERFDLPFGTLVSVPAVRIVQAGENPADPASEYVDLLFSRNAGTAQRINRQPGTP